jgi:chaperonin cofactor prefoldin
MPRSRKTQDKDVITRLADKGEEALQKLGDLPGGKSLLKAVGDIRTRLDDTSAKLRKLDPLERRVSSIENRLNALEGPKKSTPKRTAKRKTAARKPAAPKPATPAEPESS